MATTNTGTDLWNQRREGWVKGGQKGQYADIRKDLVTALRRAKRYSLLGKQTARHTYEKAFQLHLRGYSDAIVELQINFATKQLQLAWRLSSESSSAAKYYNLTENGLVVDLNTMEPLPDDEIWPELKSYLAEVVRKLDSSVDDRRSEKRELGIHIATIGAWVLGVLLLIGLCIMCARWWFFEPRENANRARITYDATSQQIEGTGYAIDAHALDVIPASKLRAMPSYGGDDMSLAHPRTIPVTSDKNGAWCDSITVDLPGGSHLVVATTEDSPFARDHYVATYANRTLTVCLVDGFVKNDASKNATATLAIQSK